MRDPMERTRLRNMEDAGFGPRVMMRLKVCTYCGTVEDHRWLLCRECGRRLPKQTLYQQYKEHHRCCPVCETVLPDRAMYCPQCGATLRGSGKA